MDTPDPLRAEALAARARGDHDRAIAAWRALLLVRPDDWTLGLELKHDLKAALHYPDSDAQFRRAAQQLPDHEWLAHYAALYAFHNGDLEALDQRARRLAATSPAEPKLQAILGDVARQRRDWTGAEMAFAAAARMDPGNEEYRAKLDAARMYRRIAAVPPGADGAMRYAVAVVNLDRNGERREEIARQFATCPAPLHRVAAVEGSRLPSGAVERLTGNAGAPRGTLGCFLSHAAAWEAMLARGDAYCLVIEDDVVPLLELPATLDPFGLPPDFELCFVNDRLEPRLDRDAAGFRVSTLAETMLGFHPESNAPGGDGYFLSRAGAGKLLAWVGEDGFAEDVDWRLLAYGLAPSRIAALPRHGHAWAVLDRLQHLVGRAARLHACVLHPALIRTVGVSSDREDQNRMHPG